MPFNNIRHLDETTTEVNTANGMELNQCTALDSLHRLHRRM